MAMICCFSFFAIVAIYSALVFARRRNENNEKMSAEIKAKEENEYQCTSKHLTALLFSFVTLVSSLLYILGSGLAGDEFDNLNNLTMICDFEDIVISCAVETLPKVCVLSIIPIVLISILNLYLNGKLTKEEFDDEAAETGILPALDFFGPTL